MKGVILAGGLGTRLYPLTWATNKHLLPIYDKPMIFYPIETLVKAGVKEVLVVSSGPHAGHFLRVLKNGKELGLNHLEYAFQEKPDGGIADALALAKDFSDNEPITVILGDNTTDANIKKEVSSFKDGAFVFLKDVPDPERYGVPEFDGAGRIINIEEKPKSPKSNYAVTGLYIFDQSVFEIIKTIKPSGRGQLEITDVNNEYIKKQALGWAELEGFWTDAGTYASLFKAAKYWAEKSGYSEEKA
jgi:glucose-1-phosphate thymidylyltransferase